MLLDIERAKIYTLASGSSDSRYYIGGLDEMNHLAYLMKPGDLFATAGVENDVCTLLVTWDDKKCEEMIEEMRELIRKEKEDLKKLEEKDQNE